MGGCYLPLHYLLVGIDFLKSHLPSSVGVDVTAPHSNELIEVFKVHKDVHVFFSIALHSHNPLKIILSCSSSHSPHFCILLKIHIDISLVSIQAKTMKHTKCLLFYCI